MHRTPTIIALAATGLVASVNSTATAEILTVCASGCQYTSINAAIDDASDGDVIQLAAETYYEGSVIATDGKAITLRGSTDKAGNAASTLDGGDYHRVLICQNSETGTTRFENLVIRSGFSNDGAGMYNYNSSPSLTNCTFTGNGALDGGGMLNDYSSPTLNDCTFTSNTASSTGGGMYNYESNPTLTNCRFTENSADDAGGGMFNSIGSSPTLNDCTFTSNTAGTDGGGMGNDRSSPNLKDCTFTGNTADTGGGMLNFESNPTLNDCTFTSNTARSDGGGMFNFKSEPNLIDCLIAGNSAVWSGGGMVILGTTEEAHATGTGLSLCGNTPENIFSHWNGDYVGTYTCQSTLADCSDCNDTDGDGIPDFMDACPGEDDTVDSDADGTPDGCDGCPDDPAKTEPGTCGCGVVDRLLAGDLDCDGDVDAADFALLRNQIGVETLGCVVADINGDGDVDGADFAYVLGYWGVCSAP